MNRVELRGVAWRLFAFAVVVGAFAMITGCGATPAEIKETGHWFGSFLPAPLGGIADSAATILAAFVAWKGGRHLHKRAKARHDQRKGKPAPGMVDPVPPNTGS